MTRKHKDDAPAKPLLEEDEEGVDESEFTEDDIDEDTQGIAGSDDVFSAPLTGSAQKLQDANDQASRGMPLKAAGKLIDPSVRKRGAGLPGATPYLSHEKRNEKSAKPGDVRYVVRYQRRKDLKTDRARTLHDPEGLFETKAEAEEVASRMRKQRVKLKDGRVTKLLKFKNVRVSEEGLPPRILTWNKWAQLRLDIRKYALGRGLALSGGDRTPERNEQVGGVRNSSHLTTRTDRWADDYIGGSNYELMQSVMEGIRARFGQHGRLELLIHDAGSGSHLHVGGPTDGAN